jgi:predicted phage terminase large subunit-like protein
MAVTIYVEQEPGSGGKESADATVRNLKGFIIKKDRPTGDKDTRLGPFEVQAEAGNVRLVRGAWNQDFIEEMIAIPNGTHRDQGDAAAGAFNRLTDTKPSGAKVSTSGLYKGRQTKQQRNPRKRSA